GRDAGVRYDGRPEGTDGQGTRRVDSRVVQDRRALAGRAGGEARCRARLVGERAHRGRRAQAAPGRSRRASGFHRAPAGARARSGASRATPLIMDIEGVLAIIFLFGGGTLFLLSISPIGRAFAERIRGKRSEERRVGNKWRR